MYRLPRCKFGRKVVALGKPQHHCFSTCPGPGRWLVGGCPRLGQHVATQDERCTDVSTVVIVDDHHTFADLLAIALDNEPDFHVVGKATNASTALDLVMRLRPTVVVMDIDLGGQDGLAVTRRIREARPDAIVVIVSAHADASSVARSGAAGANGFATKTGSLSDLLSVVRNAHAGSTIGALAPTTTPAQAQPGVTTSSPLTAREREVLELMGQGVTAVQIARMLNISVHTCRGYMKSIHAKLGVRSQLEAVVRAQELGLLERRR